MKMPRTKEDLAARIRQHSQTAMEARQVWRRLESLLPSRLKILQESLPMYRERHGRQRAMLQALCLDEYQERIEELVSTSGTARRARVEYETHLMMLEAQKTLRLLRSRSNRSR